MATGFDIIPNVVGFAQLQESEKKGRAPFEALIKAKEIGSSSLNLQDKLLGLRNILDEVDPEDAKVLKSISKEMRSLVDKKNKFISITHEKKSLEHDRRARRLADFSSDFPFDYPTDFPEDNMRGIGTFDLEGLSGVRAMESPPVRTNQLIGPSPSSGRSGTIGFESSRLSSPAEDVGSIGFESSRLSSPAEGVGSIGFESSRLSSPVGSLGSIGFESSISQSPFDFSNSGRDSLLQTPRVSESSISQSPIDFSNSGRDSLLQTPRVSESSLSSMEMFVRDLTERLDKIPKRLPLIRERVKRRMTESSSSLSPIEFTREPSPIDTTQLISPSAFSSLSSSRRPSPSSAFSSLSSSRLPSRVISPIIQSGQNRDSILGL